MLEERAWGERRGRAPLREQTGVRGEEKKAAGEGLGRNLGLITSNLFNKLQEASLSG